MLTKPHLVFNGVISITLVILFFIASPIISIWAINQLFGTAIAINFWNWVAVNWLYLIATSIKK